MRVACLQAGLAGFLACASGAQSQVDPNTGTSLLGFELGDKLRDTGARERIAEVVRRTFGDDAAASQDRDYSARALFMEGHGKFLSSMDRYRPMLQASYLFQRTAAVKSEAGHFDLDHVTVDGRIRWPVDPDTYLVIGPRFSSRHYNFNPQVVGAQDDTLYVAGAHLGFGTFIDESTLLQLVFSPGIYSDFDGTLKSRDWKWYGEGLVTLRQTDDLYWKLGVYYSDDFRDANVLPLAGVSWQFLPSMRLDILLPKYAEISVNPWSSTVFHLGVDQGGEQYRWRSDVATGKVPADIWVQEIRARVGVVQRLSDNFALYANAGLNIAGHYRFVDTAGNRYNGTLEPDFLVMVGFGIDF